jgi:hypothetical protein
MELDKKLQLKAGQGIEAISVPEGITAILHHFATTSANASDGAFIFFVSHRASLEHHRPQIVDAVNAERLTWVSYPKAGQLGTDLNRDTLSALLGESGIQPVRQISIDQVWSALRFRPST